MNGRTTNNYIESAVPFLTIAPDSRSGAMGDVGAALSPDINSINWNSAKYAFIENEMGIAFSYTPWLRNLVGDIDLAFLSAYKRLDKSQVVAGSFRYFALGDIELTDENGEYYQTARPNEFAIDAAYARAFGKKFGGGIAFRFIHSDLSNGVSTSNVQTKAANAFAADISVYYNNKIKISDKEGILSFGMNISNIGTKMSYTFENVNKDFLPTNLKLGGALKIDIDDYNSLTTAIDLNKLLVPTPPIYSDTNRDSIIAGKDPNVPVIVGIFQSFYDAPGGFKEEIKEIMYSVGFEYWYRKQFAVRAGYFHESAEKGNRKFFTAGLGLRLNVFGVDFSYLIPQAVNNPLANTLRFTLSFDLDSFRKLRNR